MLTMIDLGVWPPQKHGKPELLCVLPPDARMIDEARLILKTNKYIQQNTGADIDDTRRSILTQRGQQKQRPQDQSADALW